MESRSGRQHGDALAPADRVWLIVEPPRSCGEVRLNGEVLGQVRGGASDRRFDVTQLLSDRNALEIEVEHPERDVQGMPLDDARRYTPGGLVGEVRLEIESLIGTREPESGTAK